MILITVLIFILLLPLAVLLLFGAAGAVIALIAGVFMLIFAVIVRSFVIPWFENRDKMRLDIDHILVKPRKLEVRFDGYSGGYVIDCYYTDENTGREFTFTSKAFTQDPSAYLNNAEIGVFVNPTDYSNYYVDTSKLDFKERL